jgi:hypothetical protein
VAEYLGIKGTAAPVAEITAAREARERRDVEEALVHELLVLLQVLQARVSSRALAANGRFRAARPDWAPPAEEDTKRERLAARRIRNGLEALYGRSR